MENDLLLEYALIKSKIKEFKKREDELKPLVLKQVILNGKPIKNDLGTYIETRVPVYEYSDELKAKIEEIKILQEDEKESGVAKVKERIQLTFKPIKK